MLKKDYNKTSTNEINSKPSRKNYKTNKIVSNHIDEKWSIDLANFSYYRILNNKSYRYILIVCDDFQNI